jgi:hypothetical protein
VGGLALQHRPMRINSRYFAHHDQDVVTGDGDSRRKGSGLLFCLVQDEDVSPNHRERDFYTTNNNSKHYRWYPTSATWWRIDLAQMGISGVSNDVHPVLKKT